MVLVLLCKTKREVNKKNKAHTNTKTPLHFSNGRKKSIWKAKPVFFSKENLFDFLVVFFRPLKMGRNFVYGFVLVFFVHGKSSTQLV